MTLSLAFELAEECPSQKITVYLKKDYKDDGKMDLIVEMTEII